jgi:hypothetical protein
VALERNQEAWAIAHEGLTRIKTAGERAIKFTAPVASKAAKASAYQTPAHHQISGIFPSLKKGILKLKNLLTSVVL